MVINHLLTGMILQELKRPLQPNPKTAGQPTNQPTNQPTPPKKYPAHRNIQAYELNPLVIPLL